MIQVADVGVGISGQEGMQVRGTVGGAIREPEGRMKRGCRVTCRGS